MKLAGIDGVRRGKHRTVTTERDDRAPRHPDLAHRRWAIPTRPDQWWVADFTYVWTTAGFCCVSFITDVFSRRILGWRVMTVKTTPLVASALAQAVAVRRRGLVEFTATGLRRRLPVHVPRVHRRTPRSRDRRVDRDRRRCLWQLPHGAHDRPVQDRGHRARAGHLDIVAARRAGHRVLGALVQPRTATLRDRTPRTRRVRGPRLRSSPRRRAPTRRRTQPSEDPRPIHSSSAGSNGGRATSLDHQTLLHLSGAGQFSRTVTQSMRGGGAKGQIACDPTGTIR